MCTLQFRSISSYIQRQTNHVCSYTAMACYFHPARLRSVSCLSLLSQSALLSCAYVCGASFRREGLGMAGEIMILSWNLKCFLVFSFISCLVCGNMRPRSNISELCLVSPIASLVKFLFKLFEESKK